jgi:hypothetical protein
MAMPSSSASRILIHSVYLVFFFARQSCPGCVDLSGSQSLCSGLRYRQIQQDFRTFVFPGAGDVENVFPMIEKLEPADHVAEPYAVRFIALCADRRPAGQQGRDLFFRHALAVVPDGNRDVFSGPVDRQRDLCRPGNIADTVIDGIFDDGLQDHARHRDIDQILVDAFLIIDIAGKTYVDDINIIIDQRNFIRQAGDLFFPVGLGAEEGGHILQIAVGRVRVFHHGQLCAGIQRVEKKMRIDLRLQVFQLSFLQVRVHAEFVFLQPAFQFHGGAQLFNIAADTHHHLIEGCRHHADLVIAPDFQFGNVEASGTDAVGVRGKSGKRIRDTFCKEQRDRKIGCRYRCQEQKGNELEGTEGSAERTVVDRIVPELDAVQTVDIGVKVAE